MKQSEGCKEQEEDERTNLHHLTDLRSHSRELRVRRDLGEDGKDEVQKGTKRERGRQRTIWSTIAGSERRAFICA